MKLLKVCLVFAVLLAGVQVFATESGGGAYPNGAEGFMTGAVPPPGHYLINYMLYYGASDMVDGNGDDMPIDFDLMVVGNVFRIVNVTKIQLLGASWAQHIFVPVMHMDVTTPGGSDDATGLGDIIIDPIILAWHTPTVHVAAGIDIYVPVGKYDDGDIANLGRNYWTIEPVVAVTYRNAAGYEASAKFMYDFNTENEDTDYESGKEFHFDYTLAKYFGGLGVGVGGFYYQQTTDDDGMVMTPGGPVDAGHNRGYQLAAGPQVSYQHKGMFFNLKYQSEFETENKPEGNRVWLKFITAF